MDADLELCAAYDGIIRTLEKTADQQAATHDAHSLHILQTTPGMGRILGLTVNTEIPTREAVHLFSFQCHDVSECGR